MNRLAAILPPAQVLVHVEVTSKKRAFEEAGLLFEDLHGLSRALVADSLFARERLGSTGLGHGVAIPHGRIKGLKSPMAAVFQLAQPIGFDAPDEQPVSLLIFLLVPEASTQKHLEILSEIAELLSDTTLREKISNAIRTALSPRFVPNDMFQVAEIPRTLSGKKQELPIKKLLLGQPLEKVVNKDAMANPQCLDWYVAFAERRAVPAAAAG